MKGRNETPLEKDEKMRGRQGNGKEYRETKGSHRCGERAKRDWGRCRPEEGGGILREGKKNCLRLKKLEGLTGKKGRGGEP